MSGHLGIVTQLKSRFLRRSQKSGTGVPDWVGSGLEVQGGSETATGRAGPRARRAPRRAAPG